MDTTFDSCSEQSWQFICQQLLFRLASLISATEAGLFVSDAGTPALSVKMREVVHLRSAPHTPAQRGAAAAAFRTLVERSIMLGSDTAFYVGHDKWCLIVQYKEASVVRAALAVIVIAKDGSDAKRRLRILQGLRDELNEPPAKG